MGIKRKPFQGVLNIIKFNWHFYLIAIICIASISIFHFFIPNFFKSYFAYFVLIAVTPLFLSLFISYYIYDYSGLYKFKWLPNLDDQNVLNINAGFDEASEVLRSYYPKIKLAICDFYDPGLHTEVSIKRARNFYPPAKETIQVDTHKLPFENNSFDYCIAFFAAHEIRNEKERILFFKELHRVTKNSGQILITEHLRDINNFIAYTIGFFHFLSKKTWIKTFKQANLTIVNELNLNPFVKTFILEKNGDTF